MLRHRQATLHLPEFSLSFREAVLRSAKLSGRRIGSQRHLPGVPPVGSFSPHLSGLSTLLRINDEQTNLRPAVRRSRHWLPRLRFLSASWRTNVAHGFPD